MKQIAALFSRSHTKKLLKFFPTSRALSREHQKIASNTQHCYHFKLSCVWLWTSRRESKLCPSTSEDLLLFSWTFASHLRSRAGDQPGWKWAEKRRPKLNEKLTINKYLFLYSLTPPTRQFRAPDNIFRPQTTSLCSCALAHDISSDISDSLGVLAREWEDIYASSRGKKQFFTYSLIFHFSTRLSFVTRQVTVWDTSISGSRIAVSFCFTYKRARKRKKKKSCVSRVWFPLKIKNSLMN